MLEDRTTRAVTQRRRRDHVRIKFASSVSANYKLSQVLVPGLLLI